MTTYKVYRSGNNYEIYAYEEPAHDNSEAMLVYQEKKKRYADLKIMLERHESKLDHAKKSTEGYAYNDLYGEISILKVEKEYAELKEYFDLVEKRRQENLADVDLKEKRRKQTLRENAMNLKRMAREHFTDNAFMVTLTYAEKWACDKTQIDKSDRRLKDFWTKLRRDGFEPKYVGVRELQKARGDVIHYHFIVESPKLYNQYKNANATIVKKTKNEQHKQFENNFHKKYWKFGWVDIRLIQGEIDDTGAYLAKYMTKEKIENMEWLEKRRLVLRSEGIKKVESLNPISDATEISEVLNDLDLYKNIALKDLFFKLPRKRVFYNSYESDYCGKVEYIEIHKTRLENGIDIVD